MLNVPYRKAKGWISRLAGRDPTGFSSAEYWDQRYKNKGNSGAGSYAHLAAFKADFLNSFIKEHDVESVVEFGCGDGNQLRLAEYPRYAGYDVSPRSIEMCRNLFAGDPSKSFHLISEFTGEKADLSLSLDVIYHLVEDEVFHTYMATLFRSSAQWVIVYSSNRDTNDADQSLHVRHRKFTEWIAREVAGYELIGHTPNRYPMDRFGAEGSFADFFVFQKRY
ncbi:MAG: methyltransferase domain-containing protein [Limnohabitans sp.]